MARKVTISRDMILEAALKILIRDGYAAVNIKTIASEIGCSTQPVVWHFENMDGLRQALSEYAGEYAAKKAFLDSRNKVESFEFMGRAYVKMALKELVTIFRKTYDPSMGNYIYINHADCAPRAEKLKEMLLAEFPNLDITTMMMSPIIGAHTGPGMAAICFMGR